MGPLLRKDVPLSPIQCPATGTAYYINDVLLDPSVYL